MGIARRAVKRFLLAARSTVATRRFKGRAVPLAAAGRALYPVAMLVKDLLLILAAFAAGAQNAIAGGGSFLTFPALVFAGVPPIQANASSTVVVFPAALSAAWGYRHDFQKFEGVGMLPLILISTLGGALGAGLLLATPQQLFGQVVPWLLAMATLLFAFGRQVTPWLRQRIHIGPAALLAIQFVIAIYGGYFGGAIGIMMLALYGLFGLTDLNAMNGMKSLVAGLLNAVAVVVFIIAGKVWWFEAGIMVGACMLGGYAGARLGRRINPTILRWVIVAIGTTMTVIFFARR